MRKIVFILALLWCFVGARADWYGDKYSMFVHYGLYSIPGGVYNGVPVERGYSEQILTFGIGFSDWYEAFADDFSAEHFDADEIVALAKAGGMRSVVMTSKHHDGFCLFDTETTTYNSVDATPSGRDLIGELAQACHDAGLGFGIYFSLIDWHYPYAVPFSSHNADPITPPHHQYNMQQVRELLTNYGRVDELWFDMGSLTAEQSAELYALVHELQPECMVSGRVGNDFADFSVMADNEYPEYRLELPWQTAASMFDETWGYRSWQERGSWEEKVEEKFASLIKVVAYGGKYLLNIGPMGDGSVVPFESQVIREIGKLIEPIRESIYDTHPTPYPLPADGVLSTMSAEGDDLFLFFPRGISEHRLPPTLSKVKNASILGEAGNVECEQYEDGAILVSNVSQGSAPYQVVKLELDSPLKLAPTAHLGRGVHTSKVATPIFAHSAIDYYASFTTILGYEWLVKPRSICELLFTNHELGRGVEVNGNLVTLLPEKSKTIKVRNDYQLSGPLYEAEQRGRFGYILDKYLSPELTDSVWQISDNTLHEPLDRKIRFRGGVHFRQDIDAKRDFLLPIELEYTDGVLVFLNGEQIDGAIKRDGGQLALLLPLKKGKNRLVLRVYNRWGKEAKLRVTLPDTYTEHAMKVPANSTQLRITKKMELPQASSSHLSNLRVRVK